jgi:hypothetical protein
MYPDGTRGRCVNVACQVHSRDAAPSATTLGNRRDLGRLLAEHSADADAAGELDCTPPVRPAWRTQSCWARGAGRVFPGFECDIHVVAA